MARQIRFLQYSNQMHYTGMKPDEVFDPITHTRMAKEVLQTWSAKRRPNGLRLFEKHGHRFAEIMAMFVG